MQQTLLVSSAGNVSHTRMHKHTNAHTRTNTRTHKYTDATDASGQ